jgi:hypothetical protein
MYIPLMIGKIVKGMVGISNLEKENAYGDSDLRLLQTLANSMSVALENARLFDETQRLLRETEQRAAELSIINSVQAGLASKLDAIITIWSATRSVGFSRPIRPLSPSTIRSTTSSPPCIMLTGKNDNRLAARTVWGGPK